MKFTQSRRLWQKYYLIPLVGVALLTTLKLPALAAGTTAGTTIENTAHGSFENPNDAGTVIPVDSNTVILTISEVAGISVSNQGIPVEAPPADVVNDGPGQGDSVISAEDIVYFTYRITNVGNDQTQFFIPDAPANVLNGAFQSANPIEIVEYFDGTTTTGLNIPVTTGAATGTFPAIPNDGSVPVDGYIDVRVPVKVDAGLTPGVDTVTVVLGNTISDAATDQNVQLDNNGEFGAGNNVNTVDNPDPNAVGDIAGAPVFEREASSVQITSLGVPNLDYGDAPDAAAGTATGDYESAPGRGPSHVVGPLMLGTAVDAENTFGEDGAVEDDAVIINDGATNPSLHGQSLLAGDTYNLDITTVGTGNLSVWIDFNQNGSFEDPGEKVADDVASTGATETVAVTVPIGATGGATFARVRYSSQANLLSTGAAPDGEVEDYSITLTPADPALRLVKRVTRVGATNFSAFVDDAGDPDDTAANWPSATFVAGEIAAAAEPGEEVDYTIYFLSDGNTPISNIRLCDLIPDDTSYVANSLVMNLGGAGDTLLSDASDADAGEKFPVGGPPAPCPAAGDTEGGVLVQVASADNATAPGVPASSFGYIRFTVIVD